MNGRVLVVCASRGRRDRLDRMVASVLRTSTKADIAVWEDEDDPQAEPRLSGDYNQVVGPRLGPCRSLNKLVAMFPDYEAYGAATDDCTFETPGWDEWVLGQVKSFEGGVGAIAPHSDQSVPRMDFPWVTNRWVEAAGSFIPLGTYQAYWDVALQLVGEATQIRFAKPDEFRIWHESMEVSDRAGMDSKEPRTFMFYLYHLYNDAQIVCVWLAHERKLLVDKLTEAAR